MECLRPWPQGFSIGGGGGGKGGGGISFTSYLPPPFFPTSDDYEYTDTKCILKAFTKFSSSLLMNTYCQRLMDCACVCVCVDGLDGLCVCVCVCGWTTDFL